MDLNGPIIGSDYYEQCLLYIQHTIILSSDISAATLEAILNTEPAVTGLHVTKHDSVLMHTRTTANRSNVEDGSSIILMPDAILFLISFCCGLTDSVNECECLVAAG